MIYSVFLCDSGILDARIQTTIMLKKKIHQKLTMKQQQNKQKKLNRMNRLKQQTTKIDELLMFLMQK